MEFLGNLHAQTNACLDKISSRIDYVAQAREEVFVKLGCVDSLTLYQRYDLCDILSDKPQRMEVFKGVHANAKLEYVLHLLAKNCASV